MILFPILLWWAVETIFDYIFKITQQHSLCVNDVTECTMRLYFCRSGFCVETWSKQKKNSLFYSITEQKLSHFPKIQDFSWLFLQLFYALVLCKAVLRQNWRAGKNLKILYKLFIEYFALSNLGPCGQERGQASSVLLGTGLWGGKAGQPQLETSDLISYQGQLIRGLPS